MSSVGDFLIGRGDNKAPVYLPNGEMVFQHRITTPSVAGVSNYFIPVGDYFLDAATESVLEIDMGAGFVTQVYGVSYDHFRRTAAGAPGVSAAILADTAFGWRYLAGAVPAGWTFRFAWLQRVILKTPPALAKIRLTGVGGTLDLANNWSMNGATPTNGVTVPELTNLISGTLQTYSVEFWRRVERPGGFNTGPSQRRGPRYLPLYRGPLNQFNFHVDEFATGGISRHTRKYRVCYYRAGSRSALSADVVVVCNTSGNLDRSGLAPLGPSFPTRGLRTVWIASG